MEFVDKLREASSITGRISEAEAMTVSSKTDDQTLINEKKRLSEIKQELNDLTSSYIGHKYTKKCVLLSQLVFFTDGGYFFGLVNVVDNAFFYIILC